MGKAISINGIYKAKSIDKDKWIEGYLFDDGMVESSKMFVGNIVIEEYHGTADDGWEITGTDFYEVDPSTICQYTGLTDKKIWENDIVAYEGKKGIVKFGEYEWYGRHYGFYIDWTDDCLMRPDILYWADKVKVVGNVFDDPDLLRGDEKNGAKTGR